MSNPRVQYTFISIILCWVLISSINIFVKKTPESVSLPLTAAEPAPSENPQDRAAYETMMLVDPRTGEIPSGIKAKEQEFAKTLPTKSGRIPGIQGVESPEGTEALNWQSIGPTNFGGRTRALAIDVTDDQTILAGAVSGGVWRSEDGGQSWTKTTTPQQLHSVTTIVQDIRPGKENTWYYGTGELLGNSARGRGAPLRGDGIYKSSDGGRTWQILPSTATNDPARFNYPFNYVWDIEINPNSTDDEVIAAIFGGIVKSSDGGATWTTVLGDDLLALGEETNLNDITAIFYTDVHRTTNGTFYATLSSITNDPNTLSGLGGFYKSSNGDNWSRVQELFSFPNRRTEIGSSPSNPDIVYAITDGSQSISMFKYDDNQRSITDLTANVPMFGGEFGDFNAQSSYNLFIAVHPDNENVVFTGGTDLYRSTDGFSTTNNTTWIGGYSLDNDASLYENHHADQHDVIFHPANANRMFSINDGGIFQTQNNMAEEVAYTPMNNGYVTTQYYSIEVSRSGDDDFVIGGTQDNGTLLTTTAGGNNTVRSLGGDGGIVASTKFGVYYYMSFQNSQIYRMTLSDQNQLTSFARVDPIGAGQASNQGYLFVNPYSLDPNNQNRMYLAGGDFVWRNRNLSQIPAGKQIKTGFNWTKMIGTSIASGSISALDVSTVPPNILYYGSTNGRLFKVENANIDDFTVSNLNQNPGVSLPSSANISSINIDPTSAENVLVTFSNYEVPSIFFSQDGGTTFTDVSGNLEENPDGTGNGPSVRWAEIVPLQDGSYQYYVGTSTGLYSTINLNGSSTLWVQEGPNTIGNVVVPMVDFRRVDGQIAVATHGNGLYFSQISNVVPEPITSSFDQLSVETAFPNPFTDLITLRFGLPESDFVVVRIYDMQGRLVTTASAGLSFEGSNEIFWDGTNEVGQRVVDGIYLVRLTYRDQNASQRVILSRQ